ncbi:hypothetical protein C8R45DRAFT_1100923 [Mycena sanguinolenta]|nr:hypothetical protein C8R45DRAFT_1100923 [Mycena sanguinolenta]
MASPLTRSSSRASATSSPHRNPASLIARHAILYPVTVSLNIHGSKKAKQQQVNALLREELESKTSPPSFSMRLISDYRGHNLTSPLLNTDKNPGGYRQVCKGCFRAPCPPPPGTPRRHSAKYKPAVFNISPALAPHILQSGMLGRLIRAKAELSAVHRPRSSVVAPVVSSHSPSPPLVSSRATTAEPAAEVNTAPATPVHYTPDGYIVTDTASNTDTSDDEELLYPPSEAEEDTRPLDVSVPVYIFAWDDERYVPVRIIAHPRVVLQDYRQASIAAGFSVQSRIQRYIERGVWIDVDWSSDTVSVFGTNRVIYYRNPGIDVSPPDHVLELYGDDFSR